MRIFRFVIDNSLLLVAGTLTALIWANWAPDFSYMAARIVFKPGDPAIPFLLLLAIADEDEVKMGALLSFIAAPLGIALGWILRVGGNGRRTAGTRAARAAHAI